MREHILEREEFYKLLLDVVKDLLGRDLLSVIVFGSTVYMGGGRDVDVLVVVEDDIGMREKREVEYSIWRRLCRKHRVCDVDLHVLSFRDFILNLEVASFLSGLALGYVVIFDAIGVEKYILEFLNRLSREKYILHLSLIHI